MVAPMSVFMSCRLFCVVVVKESPLCSQPDWQEVKAHHLGTVQGGAVGGHTPSNCSSGAPSACQK